MITHLAPWRADTPDSASEGYSPACKWKAGGEALTRANECTEEGDAGQNSQKNMKTRQQICLRPRGSSASRLQLCAQTSSINIRTRRIILIDVNASSCELASNSEELLRG